LTNQLYECTCQMASSANAGIPATPPSLIEFCDQCDYRDISCEVFVTARLACPQ